MKIYLILVRYIRNRKKTKKKKIVCTQFFFIYLLNVRNATIPAVYANIVHDFVDQCRNRATIDNKFKVINLYHVLWRRFISMFFLHLYCKYAVRMQWREVYKLHDVYRITTWLVPGHARQIFVDARRSDRDPRTISNRQNLSILIKIYSFFL